MSAAGYKLTVYMTANFGVSLLGSDYYPIQRFAVVARNIVVGISTLGTTFSFIISIGLVGLGVAVTNGVAKGELDPNAMREEVDAKEGQVRNTADVIRLLRDGNKDADRVKY